LANAISAAAHDAWGCLGLVFSCWLFVKGLLHKALLHKALLHKALLHKALLHKALDESGRFWQDVQ
jgi:hypothetical protein